MALNPIEPLYSASATATSGSTTITVTGNVNCSFLSKGSIVCLGTSQAQAAVSGTAPDGSGNSTITLKRPWPTGTVTAPLLAFMSYEGLADAVIRLRNIADAQSGSLSGGLVFRGSWDASLGVAPSIPAEDAGTDIYRISVAGTINSKPLVVGELLFYDPFLAEWRGTYAGLGSLAFVNTINNANWSGTALSVTNGGTGVSTLTGLVKGNGTAAMTAAVAGTDYVVPSGNTATATKLATARTIGLTGDVTGSVSFDGSANVNITAVVVDDSHSHIIGNVDGLQTALDAKAPLASPALTGAPTAPTAAVGTNTTQLATTAFVNAEIANDAPTKTGGGASGSWGISITGSAATWTTARNLTIGNTAKSVNGSANVSWSLSEIGAISPSDLNTRLGTTGNLGALALLSSLGTLTNGSNNSTSAVLTNPNGIAGPYMNARWSVDSSNRFLEIVAQDNLGQVQNGFNVNGDGLSRIAPNRSGFYTLYDKGNILGSVSLSGSTPTGGILERGTTGMWQYTKYADGRLEYTLPPKFWDAIGGGSPAVPFNANDSLTFPAPFSGVEPSISVQYIGRAPFEENTAQAHSLALSGVSVSCTLRTAVSGPRYTVTAIGRWY